MMPIFWRWFGLDDGVIRENNRYKPASKLAKRFKVCKNLRQTATLFQQPFNVSLLLRNEDIYCQLLMPTIAPQELLHILECELEPIQHPID